MQLDPIISFHGTDPSDEVRELILRKISKLDRIYGRLTSCRVAVEVPHAKPGSENHHYHVRIDVTLPGMELVVTRDPGGQDPHNHPFFAVREAFHSLERQLKRKAEKRKDREFGHPRAGAKHGLVRKIFSDRGFGFLESEDGREIYFDRNSVLHDQFDRLEVNEEVRFDDEEGEEGPQASTVARLGKSGRTKGQRTAFFPETDEEIA